MLSTADNGGVIENAGTAEFELSTTGFAVTSNLTINATPVEVLGDFLTDAVAGTASNFDVEFSDPDGDNTYTGTIAIPIHDDSGGEATGSIQLWLNKDTAAVTSYQLGNIREGAKTIWDDDAPELSLTANSPNVTESENAEVVFTISAQSSPSSTFTLYYNVSVSTDQSAGDFILSANLGDQSNDVDLTGGKN